MATVPKIQNDRLRPPLRPRTDPHDGANQRASRHCLGAIGGGDEPRLHRYASTVVLTFDQMESLLGFALPEAAHKERAW